MQKERRVFKIDVGRLDEKDVQKFIDEVSFKLKKGPEYIEPGLIYSEDYIPKQKILKVKEWLRLQTYGKKSINKDFYTTFKGIPEINLKIESRTIETEMWKIVDGVAIRNIDNSLKLTEGELTFNKISENIKKIGL